MNSAAKPSQRGSMETPNIDQKAIERNLFRQPSRIVQLLYPGVTSGEILSLLLGFAELNDDLMEMREDIHRIIPAVLTNDYDGFLRIGDSTPSPRICRDGVWRHKTPWTSAALAAMADYSEWAENHLPQSQRAGGVTKERLLLSVICICGGCYRDNWCGIEAATRAVVMYAKHEFGSLSHPLLAEIGRDVLILCPASLFQFHLVWNVILSQVLNRIIDWDPLLHVRYAVLRDESELARVMPYFIEEASEPERFHNEYSEWLCSFIDEKEMERVRGIVSEVHSSLAHAYHGLESG